MSSVSQHHAQWLSMIRLQLLTARQQAAAPAPLSSLALNTMQDATESMILLCADKLGVTLGKRDDFDTMLGSVVAGMDEDVKSYVLSLRAMNRARVNFKHSGNRADDSTVRQHMDTVEAAVGQLARSVFDVELADVSLLVLVSNSDVRHRLLVAQRMRETGQYGEAQADLAEAFHQLLADFERRRSRPHRSAFSTKPAFAPRKSGGELDILGSTVDWLEAIDEQLRVLLMGVDPQGYAYFRAHTPTLMHFLGEGAGYGANFQGEIVRLSNEAWDRCVQFVIETSLRFDANDFEVPQTYSNSSMMLRRKPSDDPVISERQGEITG